MSEDKQSEDKQELLEIYKLHAELADRVRQRQEEVNKLYVSLITVIFISLAGFLTVLPQFNPENKEFLVGASFFFAGLLSLLISLSWYYTIHSYYRSNEIKFNMSCELEKKLPYDFFKCESILKNESLYILPNIFVFISCLSIIVSIFITIMFSLGILT